MGRALELAMSGRGEVEPNPMVGCVIAQDGQIIGEGYHQKYGGPHAERAALAACGRPPRGAVAYVTLEPCCHANKKTPPCVPALVEAGISEVVIGCTDPNPQVNGQGVGQLREAGVSARVGVMEAMCRQLIAPFAARMVYRRPYVTMKWAQSADCKVAGPGGRRLQISNDRSMRVVHELRGRCDGIMVGSNTVLRDDPMLTARGVKEPRPPVRYVLDRKLKIPPESRLVKSAAQIPVVVACEEEMLHSPQAEELRTQGVQLLQADSINQVLADAYDRRITHLLVEAGPGLAKVFFTGGWADRLWVFRSPESVGDPAAPAAAEIPGNFKATGTLDLDGDRLTEYLNPDSTVFFEAAASADLKLASLSGSR